MNVFLSTFRRIASSRSNRQVRAADADVAVRVLLDVLENFAAG